MAFKCGRCTDLRLPCDIMTLPGNMYCSQCTAAGKNCAKNHHGMRLNSQIAPVSSNALQLSTNAYSFSFNFGGSSFNYTGSAPVTIETPGLNTITMGAPAITNGPPAASMPESPLPVHKSQLIPHDGRSAQNKRKRGVEDIVDGQIAERGTRGIPREDRYEARLAELRKRFSSVAEARNRRRSTRQEQSPELATVGAKAAAFRSSVESGLFNAASTMFEAGREHERRHPAGTSDYSTRRNSTQGGQVAPAAEFANGPGGSVFGTAPAPLHSAADAHHRFGVPSQKPLNGNAYGNHSQPQHNVQGSEAVGGFSLYSRSGSGFIVGTGSGSYHPPPESSRETSRQVIELSDDESP